MENKYTNISIRLTQEDYLRYMKCKGEVKKKLGVPRLSSAQFIFYLIKKSDEASL